MSRARRSRSAASAVPPAAAVPMWQQGLYAVGAAAVLLLSAWALHLAWTLWQADSRARPARAAITAWSLGRPWSADQFLAAEKLLQDAQAQTPDDATLYDSLASLYMLQGSQYDPGDDEVAEAGSEAASDAQTRRSLYQSALTTLLRSLRLRPQHGVSWANLALVAYELDPGSDQQWQAWQQARRFAPWEPASRVLMAQVVLLSAENAPPEALDWFRTYRTMAPAAEFNRLQQFAQEYELAPQALALLGVSSQK